MIKDEARYLPQWVEYHLRLGFDKFVLFDNGSAPSQHPLLVLHPYRDAIEVVRVEKPDGMAASGWAHAIMQRLDCDWLWSASIDEYIRCPRGETIADILRDLDRPDIAGVCINWIAFNSIGPVGSGLVVERFTSCVRDPDEHIKTIARQGRYAKWNCPHSIAPCTGTRCVNTNGNQIDGPWAKEFVSDRAIIHHYKTMSREEYEVKMNKGRADKLDGEGARRPDAEAEWEAYHSMPSTTETSLAEVGPDLRGRLLSRYGLI